MTPDPVPTTAVGLLDAFARRTGLTGSDAAVPPGADDLPPDRSRGVAREGSSLRGSGPPRYLWTDAHAVGTWLGLHAALGEERFLRLALRLVDEVHRVLGGHRDDDARSGRLSGLEGPEAARHPTAGGLRIGKPRPERSAAEPPDAHDEWDRDGQYFHYLTRWMHALHRVAEHTHDVRYLRWAAELAAVAHDAFVVDDGSAGGPRMVWKTSVDLSRPTVPSMGHHDPLDGLVTCAELRAAARRWGGPSDLGEPLPDLTAPIESFARMCSGRRWATDDALGAGGLLIDAWRWGRLTLGGEAPAVDGSSGDLEPGAFLGRLAAEARESVEAAARVTSPATPFERRLAFRELGLSLGLHAGERLAGLLEQGGEVAEGAGPAEAGDLARHVRAIVARAPLATALEQSWLNPASRTSITWTGHEDINAVTLATSLQPGGWLG